MTQTQFNSHLWVALKTFANQGGNLNDMYAFMYWLENWRDAS